MTAVEKQTNLFPCFSDEEYVAAIRAVRQAMEEQDVHAILIVGARGSSEVHYISFRIISRNHPAGFWFPAMEKRPVLFTSSIISRVLKPDR